MTAARLASSCFLLSCLGCAEPSAERASDASSLYEDATERSGIAFVHTMGPRLNYALPEIMGAGSALLDHDNDGDLDIYLINGAASPGVEAAADPPRNRLLRQEPDHTFVDVTEGSGLGDTGFGMGVAVGDYDNDGWVDVYVTNYGPNALFRNLGDGTFRRVTDAAGVGDPAWGTSATFLDYDADGWLDLFVNNYAIFHPGTECPKATGLMDYCDIGFFEGDADRLYRNNGDGTFESTVEASNIGTAALRGLGVIAADFTGSGRTDMYVANDLQRNQLWVNQGDGTFIDEAARRGVAYNEAGAVESSMGLVYSDLDADGRLDLFMTHIGGQSHTLYRRGTGESFDDVTAVSGIFGPSQRYTGFGVGAIDVEHDGDLDLVIANGHVFRARPEPGAALGEYWNGYAQPGSLLLNDGGKFSEASARAGAFGREPQVGRGIAVGDIDEDGDLDFLTTNCGATARLFLNEAPKRGHWLMVGARDEALRRTVPGARITVIAGDRSWVRLALRGYSYLTSNDPRAHFGLGDVERFDAIEVAWPGGDVERFPGGEVDRHMTVVRGRGERS